VKREPDQVEVGKLHESVVEVYKSVVGRAVEMHVVVNHHAQVVGWDVEVDVVEACEDLLLSTETGGQNI
jgi:hypothetical protein